MLARTLRDPSLELVYWLPGFETYVDDEGKPVALPAAGSGRAATPVMHDGEPVAALVHDAALTYEPELLEVVTAAADVALERRRLHAELESRVEELAGSRARIVEASDAARRQIERDLHDGAQQRLVSLAIALRLTEDRIKDDPETAATLVAAARRELTESLEELRELARGIHPAVLEHGLDAALQSLATRSQTPVRLDVELDERLPVPVELAAYFVACEGLANVGKYAQASEATIRVRRDDDVAVIEIRDDGIGGADAASGSGLRGLADRVEALGGRLQRVEPGRAAARRSRPSCRSRYGQPHADDARSTSPSRRGRPDQRRLPAVEQTCAAQPRVDVRAGRACLLAADREAGGDACAPAVARVVLGGRAEAAHGVGRDRVDGLAREVVALGERGHDHRRPDVPDRAGEQDRVVGVDRRERVGDRRPGVGVLLSHVALDGLVVVGG